MSVRNPGWSGSRTGLRLPVALVTFLALGVALVAAGWTGAASSPPRPGDPTAQGAALVQSYFSLLSAGDVEGLDALLAPGFQAVRANGDVQAKASYLANPPQVGDFTITAVKGTKTDGVLVVSYRVTVTETIGGVEQPTGPAPRLSVFQWEKGAWRLASHANFNAIVTAGVGVILGD